VIDISKLTVKLGRNLALHNINIEIEKGKKIAIIGRTGSGKSTFIQSLYRLVEAEGESTYFINGRNT
jgi:ABC-type multidrug transport system fused ATPase/permease subunit